MPLFYVKIRKNIDICNYLPIYYPAICRGWRTFSVPSLGEGWDWALLCHHRDPVGWLVPYDTWARDLCYVFTCLMLRGLVPYDTKLAVWSSRVPSSLPRPAVPSPATQTSSCCPPFSSHYAKTWRGMAFYR